MKVVKISVLLMDVQTAFSFRKREGCSFWDALQEKIKNEFNDFTIENQSNTQAVIYAPSDMSPEDVKVTVAKLVQELISQEANNCIISVSKLSENDIARLEKNNSAIIDSKEWFKSYVSSLRGQDARTSVAASGAPRSETAPADAASGTAVSQAPATEQTASAPKNSSVPQPSADNSGEDADVPAETYKEAESLSEEITRINNAKKFLLDKVMGQRHAVNEFVNSVFEAEAFAAKDDNREGPIASFLFVGPSGVGKTHLAKMSEKVLNRNCRIIDMSEYTGNLSHMRLTGEHGGSRVLISFIRRNPNGIVIFDEAEKAHMNTIFLLLKILNDGEVEDGSTGNPISMKNNIVILTTNAGKTLYDDTTECDLSKIPRKVILDGLRKDINPNTNEPYFPESVISRFANGHVVLFNHLEPYALKEIIKVEIEKQVKLFNSSFGINVNYDPELFAAFLLYHSGGVSDARTLKGITRQIVAKELQNCVTQVYRSTGSKVNQLETINISFDIDIDDEKISPLFISRDNYAGLFFCDKEVSERFAGLDIERTNLTACDNIDDFKKAARGVVDFVVIDPTAGCRQMSVIPHDVEDYISDGMDMYEYLTTYYPEIPVYILNSTGRDEIDFETFMDRGARGVISIDAEVSGFVDRIKKISLEAHINNATFSIGRSGKVLNYNCSQFTDDEKTASIIFTRLSLEIARDTGEGAMIERSDKDNGVSFKDVYGCKKAKESLTKFIDFVKNPRDFFAQGKNIPKGVLLYGPPGTGKTMLARAMANEADVAFIPVTATSFMAPHVGESEQNIRDVFARARKFAPSIIFIDEVDAIARRRTGSETTSHYENMLNELIAQMEGFATDEKRPVFLICATNYDISGSEGMVLDPAFVRRFDDRVYIDLPDTDDRKFFFEKKLEIRAINFGEDHDTILNSVAQRTVGLNYSDLDKILNMFLAATGDSDPVGAVLLDMIDSFRYGEINKMKPETMKRIAYHESGHALVYRLLGNTPSYLTVVSRGDFGGYMAPQVEDDVTLTTYNMLMDMVCCSLAGRVSEIEFFGDDEGLNTGAGSDLSQARKYIKAALDDFAMGDTLYSKNEDAAAEKLMKEQYDRTVALVHDNRDKLEQLAQLLIKSKSLDQGQLKDFFESVGI